MDSQADQPLEPEIQPSADELKSTILDAIGEHLREHGPNDWQLLREKAEFAHVIGATSGKSGERRFWRWVAKVREDMPADQTRPHDGRDANREHQAWSVDRARLAAESLPVPPPATFFMRVGADGVETIRMADAIQLIWADLCSARALIDGSGEKPAVRGKRLTENALARTKVIREVTEILDRVHGMDALHQRYRQIVDFLLEDCAPYPHLQQGLLDRLQQANSKPTSIPLLAS